MNYRVKYLPQGPHSEENGTIHPAWWLKSELVQIFQTLFIWYLAVKAATSQLFCLLAHGYIGIMSQTYIYLILNNIKFVIKRNSVNILCYFTFPYYHQYCATCHHCLSQWALPCLKIVDSLTLRLKWSPLRKQPWCAHFAPHMILYNVNKWP